MFFLGFLQMIWKKLIKDLGSMNHCIVRIEFLMQRLRERFALTFEWHTKPLESLPFVLVAITTTRYEEPPEGAAEVLDVLEPDLWKT